MSVLVQAGRDDVSVSSAAEVNLLSADNAGVGLDGVRDYLLTVTADQDATVRIYLAAGTNAGLAIVSGWTTTVTSAAPLVLAVDRNCAARIRVTGQAVSSTATMSCDLRGLGAEA